MRGHKMRSAGSSGRKMKEPGPLWWCRPVSLPLEKEVAKRKRQVFPDQFDKALLCQGNPAALLHCLNSCSHILAFLLHLLLLHLLVPVLTSHTISFTPLVQMQKGGISVFMGVPTMYAKLLAAYDAMPPAQQKAAAEAAASLRLTVSGSSACPVPIMHRWKQLTGKYLLERCVLAGWVWVSAGPA